METFSRIIRLPMGTLNIRRVGELASRLANDVEAMRETLVVTIPMLIRHSVMLVGCLILVLQISVKLALVMIGTIPVVIVMIAIFGARIRKLTRKAQDDLAHSQVVVEESLQSIISVKAFANEAHEMARYNQNLGNFLTTAIRAAAPRAAFISFIIFAFSLALIVVTWVALTMLSKGEIPAADLSRFAALSGMIGASFAQFSELVTQLQRTLGATDRVREILLEPTEPEVPDAPKTRFKGQIEMDNISGGMITVAGNIAENPALRIHIASVKNEVLQGNSLAHALEKTGSFDALAIGFVQTGEETGTLDATLDKVSQIYERDIERKIKVLTTLLEPLMILAIGIVVGIIVISMLLPIFQISFLVR